MTRIQHHPVLAAVIGLALVLTIVIAGYGVFLAGEAGQLPWQTDPTRIPVTPFSDFPGFGAANTPASTPSGS
jgi:hypothetical protein